MPYVTSVPSLVSPNSVPFSCKCTATETLFVPMLLSSLPGAAFFSLLGYRAQPCYSSDTLHYWPNCQCKSCLLLLTGFAPYWPWQAVSQCRNKIHDMKHLREAGLVLAFVLRGCSHPCGEVMAAWMITWHP